MIERHPLELIHDLVSGRLDAEARRNVEQHLAECASCRAELERITLVRNVLRGAGEAEEMPPDLQARIASGLDAEARPAAPRRRAAFAFSAIAAILVLAAVFFFSRSRVEWPAAAAADHRSVASGAVPLEMRTADPAQLERWFDARLPFRTRVFDFAMMRYELTGGRVDSVGGRTSALFAYRGEGGDVIVCEMFAGRTSELPPGAETRVNDGITFHIYQRDGRTVVFWQEGDVVCVLAGDGPAEDVIGLAFAKAMKV